MTVKEWRAMLAVARKGVVARSPEIVQGKLLVELRGSAARLTGSDLEWLETTATHFDFEAKDGKVKEFAVCVAPKAVSSFLKGKRAGDEVLARIDDLALRLGVGEATVSILGVNARLFELIPSGEVLETCLGKGEKLIRSAVEGIDAAVGATLLGRVALATSTDETRPTLTGVLLEIADGEVTAVATDTHRIARATVAATRLRSRRSVIVHRRAIVEVAKFWARSEHCTAEVVETDRAATKKERVNRDADGNFIVGPRDEGDREQVGPPRRMRGSKLFEASGIDSKRGFSWRARSRPVDGQFPDYRKVMIDPDGCVTRVSLDAGELAAALEGLSDAAENDANRVVLVPVSCPASELDEVRLLVLGQLHDGEPPVTARAVVATTVERAESPVAVNGRYLLDALRGAPAGASVELSWAEPSLINIQNVPRPGFAEPHDPIHARCAGLDYLLMPMACLHGRDCDDESARAVEEEWGASLWREPEAKEDDEGGD